MYSYNAYQTRREEDNSREELALLRRREQHVMGDVSETDPMEREADDAANSIAHGAGINADNLSSTGMSLQGKAEEQATEQENNISVPLQSSKGGGQQLDDSIKSEMEEKMNTDLSDVRVHTDSNANQMSEDINAKAFTHDQDIYFKEGNFDTHSSEGKELLAHELVHTRQQGNEAKVRSKKEYKPKQFADDYFQSVEGYSFEKLKEYFGSDGSGPQNMKLQDQLAAIIYLNKNASPQDIWVQITEDPTQLRGYNTYGMLVSDKIILSHFEREPAEVSNVTIEDYNISHLTSVNIEYSLSKNFLIRKKKREEKRILAGQQATQFLQESAGKLHSITNEIQQSKSKLEENAQTLLNKINRSLSEEALKKKSLTSVKITDIKANAESIKKDILKYYHGSLTVINKNTESQKEKLESYWLHTQDKIAEIYNNQQIGIEKLYKEFKSSVEMLLPGFSKKIRDKGRERYESHLKDGLFTSMIQESKAEASVKASQIAEMELSVLGVQTVEEAYGNYENISEDFFTKQHQESNLLENTGSVNAEIRRIYRETLDLLDDKAALDKKAAKILMQDYYTHIDEITLGIIQALTDTLDLYYQQLNEFGEKQETIVNGFYIEAINKLTASSDELFESSRIRLEEFTRDQSGIRTPKAKKISASIETTEKELTPLLFQASGVLNAQDEQNKAGLDELNQLIFSEFTLLAEQNTLFLGTLIKNGEESYGKIKESGVQAQLQLREDHYRSIIHDVDRSKKQMNTEVSTYFKINQQQLSEIEVNLAIRLREFEEKAQQIINGLEQRMNEAERQTVKDYHSGKLKRTQNVQNFEEARDKLIGTEDAYLLYREKRGVLYIEREYNKLTDLLKKHGFEGGIEEYKQTLDDFEKGFRLATTAYALELVDIYDKQLDKALNDFNDPVKLDNLYKRMEPYRKIVKELAPHADYLTDMHLNTQSNTPSTLETTPKRVRTEKENTQIKKSKQRVEELQLAGREQLTLLYDDYPVFDDLAFPAKDQLDKKALGEVRSSQELQRILVGYIHKRKNDVKESRKQLIKDEGTEEVYILNKLMPVAFQHLGLNPKTFPGYIIQDAMKAKQRRELIWNIILAIVTIALAILAGPLGAAAGLSAAGTSFAAFGAFALGAYSAYETINDYERKSAYAALGLSSEPSFIWVVLAIVGLGLDIGPLFKSLKTLTSFKKAVISLDEIGDLAAFKKTVIQLETTGQLDAQISRTVIHAADARIGYYNAVKDFRKFALNPTINSGINPKMLGPLTRMAYFKIREGVFNFEQFLIIVQRSWNKIITDPEELKLVKQAWKEGKEGVESGVTKYADEVMEGTSNLTAKVQAKISLYPKAVDPRTGKNISLPYVEKVVHKNMRVTWTTNDRAKFIKEWYDRGYQTPIGGWDKYDIHHIKPREFGGTNDFWNLVPVERTITHKEFNNFWRQFGEL